MPRQGKRDRIKVTAFPLNKVRLGEGMNPQLSLHSPVACVWELVEIHNGCTDSG